MRSSWMRSSCWLLLFVLVDAAAAITRVTIDESTVRLTVPILVTDQTSAGIPEGLLDDWAERIHEAWSFQPGAVGQQPWIFCGRTVDVRATFELLDGSDRPGWEQWNLVSVSDRPVSQSDVPGDPVRDQATGQWAVDGAYYESAHEVGHFLGLHDEYQAVERPDGSTRNEPFDEAAAASFMGSSMGVVEPRHLAEILARHGLGPCDLLVEIDETLETGVSSELEHYHWNLASRFEVVLVEDGTGHYDLASFEAEGHRFWKLGDGCRVDAGKVPQSFESRDGSGERSKGDTVNLAIEALVRDTKSFDMRVACPGAGFGGEVPPMTITSRFEIDGELVDGRLQKQTRDTFDVLTMERRIQVRQIDGRR